MTARAIWKGRLTIGELSCPVALHAAASTAERIAFHTVNRATGNRVRRVLVDVDTGKEVPREAQVKGYETASGEYIVLEPEEIAAAVPEGDKVLGVSAFIPCGAVDTAYFDRPYYITPDGRDAEEAFVLIREGLRKEGVAALAQAVLFRRVRRMMIRPSGAGLVGDTLNFDYEVRSAGEAFADVPKLKIEGEMLDLARHIIGTRMGSFDPAAFDDRYEAAVADMVRAKIEGRKPRAPARRKDEKVVDLMEALRASAATANGGKAAPKRRAPAKAAGSKPAAGTSAAGKTTAAQTGDKKAGTAKPAAARSAATGSAGGRSATGGRRKAG